MAASSSTTGNLLPFQPFSLPASNQRTLGEPHAPGTVIPLALQLSPERAAGHDATSSLDAVVTTIKQLADRGDLDAALRRHGTLLFRGLPIQKADDFSRFAHAFGYKPHEIIGIVVDRPLLAKNVAPANESALTTTIGSHNESPQVPHAPAYIFFYAHRVPEKGGETPIGSSLEIFNKVNQEVPEFIQELAEKGVKQTTIYKPNAQYKGGSTLKQAFGKLINDEDSDEVKRQKIEDQIRRYNRPAEYTSWQWNEDGGITLEHILPAIRTQPGTGIPGFFTSLAAQYAQKKRTPDAERLRTVRDTTYGDGSAIPERYLDVLLRVTEETRVLHKWQRGDVLVYDNRIAQHGREPWEGKQEDRQVFASLWDGELPGAYGTAAFAQVVPALPDIQV
ncbi:hypothetical protein UA08_03687 [Talaromyces atroroseus]|uniref:TauD/TfdA-like domain-containing protein n=1 Tax=Talaromyces atroroseus TaxID=1441469 RepID=A0A225AIY9_TALAT|nr:hypothetical protein UA08_03687 [Talaromyces atroroseus]OKL61421.1 hypothetical protein UA08_03687 [Talaromyces atroroseus]